MNELKSAGLLMYNLINGKPKFFLVHPGGPYFKSKDEGYWSIPKGLIENGEDELDTAKREFKEETSIEPSGNFIPIGSVKQKNNKTVYAWAFKTDIDNPVEIKCNTFDLEWPPKSGKTISIPEVDRGEFFAEENARIKINHSQIEFIDRLLNLLNKKD